MTTAMHRRGGRRVESCRRNARAGATGPLVALALLLATTAVASATDAEPLAVMRALMATEKAANLDAAMALFAEDAYIVNVTGRKTADRQELQRFISSEIWLRDTFELHQPRVEDHSVSWDEPAGDAFYRRIGVAPVRFVFEAVIQNAKITSIVAHLPTREIARIKAACDAQLDAPHLHGRPCAEFVELVKIHTHHLTSAVEAH